MNSEMFIKLPPTRLFFRCAVPAVITYLVGWIDMCFSSYFTSLDHPGRSLAVAFFGTLLFPVACLFLLTPVWGLNGVWLMAPVSAAASGVLTLVLAWTMKLKNRDGSSIRLK